MTPVTVQDVHKMVRSRYRPSGLLSRLMLRGRPNVCPFHMLANYVSPNSAVLDIGCGNGLFLNLLGGGRRRYRVVRPDGSRISGVTVQELLARRYRASEWIELTNVGYRVVIVGQADVESVGCVSLLVAEDLADLARTLFVTRADSDEVILPRLELAVAQHADADTSRLQVMLHLLKLARQAEVQAETAVFDRWFYVTGFITQVLALGFARVVTKTKRDIPYTYHGQTYTIDQPSPPRSL